MAELTENQFSLLKHFCIEDVLLIFAPEALPDDDEEQLKDYATARGDIDALKENGFVEDVTDQFADVLEDVKNQKQRPFKVYKTTELAHQLFKE